MMSPGSATLPTTVQRGKRIADADVPEISDINFKYIYMMYIIMSYE